VVHVDGGKVALQRLVPLAALSALCLCAGALTAPTLGAAVARAGPHGKPVRRAARAHHSHCAKPSSYHLSGGNTHHARRRTNCRKRRSGVHHAAGAHGKRFHPSKARRHLHRSAAHPALSGYAPLPPTPGTGAGPCPDTTLVPNAGDLDRIRTSVLCLINRERAGHGESPVAPDVRLQHAAQAHTESMASQDYFEHVGPGGETLLSRMRATGYIYSTQIGYEIGENIAWGTRSRATPRAIVAAWMASPDHRANILDARFRNTGIGVSSHPPSSLAHHQPGAIYTQDFGVLVTG
jgi:uncharacterized protein YkwD